MYSESMVKAIVGNFEEYALDHKRHPHCVACNGCLVDPSPDVVLSRPLWCIACKNRIESQTQPGVPLPWKVAFV